MQEAGLVDQVRSIIDKSSLPDFVRSYNVRLGDFDGTPAVFVQFQVVAHTDTSEQGSLDRGDKLVEMSHSLDDDISKQIEDRFPFYFFEEVSEYRT